VPPTRSVFYREHAAGMYGSLPFWLAEGLVELPFTLANALAYALIVYFSVGLIPSAGKVSGRCGGGDGAWWYGRWPPWVWPAARLGASLPGGEPAN